ncbi:MAG TPA: hypothetical protein VHL59_13235 [Thermoanaerobaculia bacterium]|nr:hypothetical protein [Thermoanaerobaculia bacterium]
MDDAERDRFEDHFFGCVECAADVKSGSRFMAAGRAVVQEGATVVRLANWRWTLQAAALAAAVYAGSFIPQTPSPALISLQSEYVQSSAVRGEGEPITIDAGQLIILAAPHDADYPAWHGEIRDRAGKLIDGSPIHFADGNFYLLPRSLPAGSYSLVIFGVNEGNRVEVSRHQLRVQ